MRPAGRKRIPTMVTTLSVLVAGNIVQDPSRHPYGQKPYLGTGRGLSLYTSLLHLVCQQDCLRHFTHGFAIVHACFLNLAKCLLLAEPLFLHQKTLSPLDDLARL